jgi:N-methylhydantoinase A
VPLDEGPIDAAALAAAGERFHEMHEQRFAHADLEAPVEAVALRLTATGLVPKPKLGGSLPRPQQYARGAAQVYADDAWQQVEVYDRAWIGDAPVSGPGVIVEDYSTIFLPRGWRIAALGTGDLVARPE